MPERECVCSSTFLRLCSVNAGNVGALVNILYSSMVSYIMR